MVYIALFRVLVISGRRVLWKLCFQVFILLSQADEAGPCRVDVGAWGGCGIDDFHGEFFHSLFKVPASCRFASWYSLLPVLRSQCTVRDASWGKH
jgi:hypothetical protein